MSEPIIFKDLPATFPEKDRYKRPSLISSVIFHVVLIVVLILIPLLLPETISQRGLLITLVAPPPPPPAAPPPPAPVAAAVTPKAIKPRIQPVAPNALVMPTVIPKDVAKIIEQPVVSPIIGVVGGVPGGVAGGILGNILSANSNAAGLAAPPPPPPPPPPTPPPPKVVAPAEPVRVGGDVREPRVVRLVPPVYPPLASRARVTGTVILEATLTEDGTVDQIRVISGHPLLIDAAINCVKQWRYEPTLLNGVPVRVVLTAKVNFRDRE